MQNIRTVDARTVKKWQEKNEVILVDVREKIEYDAENIPSSTLIPLNELNLIKIPTINDKKLVIHCHSGKRSLTACDKLLKEDEYLNVYSLEGGIVAWASEGYETTISQKKIFLPLDRQAHLLIGFWVLFGTALGITFCKYFFAIPAFLGAGLIFSAITGNCTLTRILAKMPWNK